MRDLRLNEEQRAAVSWFFSPENHDGEPWRLDEPVDVDVGDDGQLRLSGCYLHTDGEWATFPQEGYAEALEATLR